MTVVAFVTSTLTSREKENAERALEKERETQALYRLTSRLTEAKELSDAAETAVVIISDLLGCQAACLCYDEREARKRPSCSGRRKERLSAKGWRAKRS